MIAYTIYIMASRSSLPHEGVHGARFLNESFEEAVQYFTEKFSSTSSTFSFSSSSSSSSSSPSSSSTSSHFPSALPAVASQITGRRKAEYLHTHFYLNSYKESERKLLDEMWMKPIIHVGEIVSGDEKVFHFTGSHMNTKAVKQKTEVHDSFLFFQLFSSLF